MQDNSMTLIYEESCMTKEEYETKYKPKFRVSLRIYKKSVNL